jgi:thiamine transport system ATP-binding protein
VLKVNSVVVEHGSTWTLNVTCRFERGTWTSLVGPSGAGKSTLVQAMAGFVPLKSGTIEIDGTDVTLHRSSERPLGYVFQQDNLFEHLTVRDNLLLATHDDPAPQAQRLGRLRDTLTRLKIPESYLGKKPNELSGGEKARVAVARALARGHHWLILDEAFAALDEPLRLSVQSWLEGLMQSEAQLSIISLTHQITDMRLFSDRILALEHGRVVFDGTLEEASDLRGAHSPALLAGLDERLSVLDPQCLGSMANAQGPTIALTPKDFRFDAPEAPSSNLWHPVVLSRPRLIAMAWGLLVRDRGTQTVLRVVHPNKTTLELLHRPPTSGLPLYLQKDAITSGSSLRPK